MVCDSRRVQTMLARRNLARCCERADWLSEAITPSSSDTDRSLPSESSFRMRMRLALLIARRTVVSLDYLLSMSGSRAMVSSLLHVVALRPAQVCCTSGLKAFDSRTACDSLTARAWSSDVKAIQA